LESQIKNKNRKKMFKLKYGWLPAHWGLKGKTREIAKAEYELSGHDLEKRLLEIRKDEIGERMYNRRICDIDFKYEKIDKKSYHRALANFIIDDKQREQALLDLDFREGIISELEFNKRSATINNEPWVTVINMDFATKNALEGSFELDWNPQFIEKLKSEGYVGPSDDNIINQWFIEVCKNIALEEFDGTGNFTPDANANLETYKRWSSDAEAHGRKGYQ
jgi:hypothetical protein